jgi:hypothetical protein
MNWTCRKCGVQNTDMIVVCTNCRANRDPGIGISCLTLILVAATTVAGAFYFIKSKKIDIDLKRYHHEQRLNEKEEE